MCVSAIKWLMEKEGGYTKLMPEEKLMTIFDACEEYKNRGIPLIVFAGRDYGMGSSRDWAAKGPALLGVRVVVAQSVERIHRSNLIGWYFASSIFKIMKTSGQPGNQRRRNILSFKAWRDKLSPHQDIYT